MVFIGDQLGEDDTVFIGFAPENGVGDMLRLVQFGNPGNLAVLHFFPATANFATIFTAHARTKPPTTQTPRTKTMAQPEAGLEKWELRKLRELNVNSWKNASDAKALLKKAMQERAKANEKKAVTSGFAAMDSKAEPATKSDDKKALDVAKISETKVEVLPASAKVDVQAPVINVHVPAPGVTINGQSFSWYPAVLACWSWVQAFVIGAAAYAALSSRLNDVIAMGLSP